jgi:hypothetical protein
MVCTLDSWRILAEGEPGEVDEFAVGVLEINYGMERVEQWLLEKGAG